MAKKQLGEVTEFYDSGNVGTNKGYTVRIKAKYGDFLVFDEDTREVSIVEKKTTTKKTTTKKTTTKNEGEEDKKDDGKEEEKKEETTNLNEGEKDGE